MKSIATMALQDGMVLAGDVYSFKGKLIAKEAEKVNKDLIARLSRHSIMCVDIKEPEDFAATRYERIRLSRSFKQFETVYSNNLSAYKFMIDSFLKEHTPVNTSYLLSIHDQIFACCKTEEQMLDMLYHLIPNEDEMTYAHMLNAALISTVFGRWIGLTGNDLKLFTLCGFFYDIGKLCLPEELIWKPDKLTTEETLLMQTHTFLGYELLRHQNINERIKTCTLHHHERCDGSGYPNGLKGDAIDTFSKYISIVDVYEAMTSARVYRQSLTPFQVIRNFERQGFEKYDILILKTILGKIAESQIGRTVRLSNEVEGDVLFINPDALSCPLIKTADGKIFDLLRFPDVTVQAML